MHTPDTAERRGDFRAPASRCGERAGECRLHAVDLDLSHQTVAVRPETAQRVRRRLAGAKQLPVGVWLDD